MKKYILIIAIVIVSVACKISDENWDYSSTKAGRIAYNATQSGLTYYLNVLNMAENVDLYRQTTDLKEKDSLALLLFYGHTITNPDANTLVLSGTSIWTFTTNGKSLNSEGAIWRVSQSVYDKPIIPEDGFIITRTAPEKWNLKITNVVLDIHERGYYYYQTSNNSSDADLDVTRLVDRPQTLSIDSDYSISGEGKFYESESNYDYSSPNSQSTLTYIEIKYKSSDSKPLVFESVSESGYYFKNIFVNGIIDLEVLVNGREKADIINVDMTTSRENDIIIKMRFNTVTEIYRPREYDPIFS